jgi:hypothetical protein
MNVVTHVMRILVLGGPRKKEQPRLKAQIPEGSPSATTWSTSQARITDRRFYGTPM